MPDTGIHDAIIEKVVLALERAMITDIDAGNDTRAGVVMAGPLQGDPDPDVARISVTVHENDPDEFTNGMPTGTDRSWMDEVEEIEIGGAVTWKRRFTTKARCLLDVTREDLDNARRIASTVRSRIEYTLLGISFSGIMENGEYVSRPVISEEMTNEMLQAGGPPDSYDFLIKVRFSLLTTTAPRFNG
jgi:hypothetical protein